MLLQAKFNYEFSIGVGEECLQYSNGSLSPAVCRIINPETQTWSRSVSFSFIVKLSNKKFASSKTKVYTIILYPVGINHTVSLFFFPSQRAGTASELLLNDPHETCMRFLLLKVESEPFGVNN